MKQDKQENDRESISPRKLVANRRNPVPQLKVLRNVAKPGATSPVGERGLKNKTVTATSISKSVEAVTKPAGSNKIDKPDATHSLLKEPQKTGAKAIVQRAGTTASVPQAMKPDAPSSAGKRAETAKLFEAMKASVDATSKQQGQKTHGKSISTQKLGKTEVHVKLKQEDKKPHAKASSPRKIAANRHNAKRSTGPRTERGKSHSRWNSHKHGILANALLVIGGPGAENVAEFNRLLQGHRQSSKPKGKREESLVETIAICDWRMARSLRAEAGLISRGFVIDRAGPAPEIKALGLVLGRDETDEREQELRAITDHLSLPLNKRLDLILRYQSTIQRIQASATNQLERLQLRRKGKQVPAPLKIQLSTD